LFANNERIVNFGREETSNDDNELRPNLNSIKFE
jgi:hypothetical protein